MWTANRAAQTAAKTMVFALAMWGMQSATALEQLHLACGTLVEEEAGDPAIGPVDAAKTLFVFTDYACPFSREMARLEVELADKQQQLRIVFKLLPIEGAPETAAKASLALAGLANWRDFHVALMHSRRGVGIESALAEAADTAGVDVNRLRDDMAKLDAAGVFERNRRLARAIGVDGTPSYAIGRHGLVGAHLDELAEFALNSAEFVVKRKNAEMLSWDDEDEDAEVHNASAEAMLAAGDYERAVADADLALEHGFHMAYVTRAKARMALGDRAGALEDYDAYVEHVSDSAAYSARADARSSVGDRAGASADYAYARFIGSEWSGGEELEGAVADADWAVELGSTAAYWMRGDMRVALNDNVGAVEDYDAYLEHRAGIAAGDPPGGISFVYWKRARARSALGDHAGAVQDFGAYLEYRPNDGDAYLRLARARMGIGDNEGAQTDVNRAFGLVPTWRCDDAYAMRAEVRDALGDYAGAIEDWGAILAHNPANSGFAYLGRANARIMTGDNEGALADADRVLELGETWHHDVYATRAFARHGLGNYAGAVEDWGTFLERFPNNAGAYKNRAAARNAAGDHEGALADADRVLELGSISAHWDRAIARHALGDHAGAAEDWGTFLQRFPDNAGAYENRANARNAAGDHNGALADAERALELGSTSAYWDRAVARNALGDHAGAVQDWGAFQQHFPGTPDAYYSRAAARNATGDHEGALADAEEAVRLAPDSADFKNGLAWMLALRQVRDPRVAVTLARQALDIADEPYIRDTLAAALVVSGNVAAAVAEYETALWGDPSLLADYRKILDTEGYDLVGDGYSPAMRHALRTFVTGGCQLIPKEDRELHALPRCMGAQ